MDVKHKGAQTELLCMTYLHGLGYDIAIPFGDNSRYDFILDTGKELLRIQVKTASKCTDTNDTYLVKTCSTGINQHQNKIKYIHCQPFGFAWILHIFVRRISL